MLGFLKYLFDQYDKSKKDSPPYDVLGNYIDPEFDQLPESQLVVSAANARILHSKATVDVKKALYKQVFYQIHKALKKGKTSAKIESSLMTPEVQEYFTSLGYFIVRVNPPNEDNNMQGRALIFRDVDDFDETTGEPIVNEPYHFYTISWNTDTTIT